MRLNITRGSSEQRRKSAKPVQASPPSHLQENLHPVDDSMTAEYPEDQGANGVGPCGKKNVSEARN
jgi:hypothetical protein